MARDGGNKKSIFSIFIAKLKGQDDMLFVPEKKPAPAVEKPAPVVEKPAPAVEDAGKKKQSSTLTFGNVVKAVIFLLICFIMISPLKSCVLTDGEYIGNIAAQKIALDDAGIISDTAKDMQTEMVKLEDGYYYKVQFTGSVTDYRYIIDADSGEIIARAFYHIQGES